MLGPYIKSRGTRGTKMSANVDLITVETYGGGGASIIRLGPSWFTSTLSLYYIKYRSNMIKTF